MNTDAESGVRSEDAGSIPASDGSSGQAWTDDLKHAACGFLMGTADVVPGVSGGTVALIVGIYERLIAAVSRVDATFVRFLKSRQWAAAFRHADGRFLAAVGAGIVTGAGGLASVIKWLLSEHRSLTFAAFSGMILASSLIVSRRVASWTAGRIGLLLLAAATAWWIATLPALRNPPDSQAYLFFCGMLGISAMILPGISGAFILLLLNRYETVLTAIRSFVHLDITADVIITLAVFAAGCLSGLLMFSRFLERLLERRHDATVAVLCGFMLGSLYRLWPFQQDLTPEITDLQEKQFQHVLPDALTGDVWAGMLTTAAAAVAVLLLDRAAQIRSVGSNGSSR